MDAYEMASAVAAHKPGYRASDLAIPHLVGRVYESAPLPERAHILDQLLRPLGVMSLLSVAGGIFACIRFRSGLQEPHVPIDDLRLVRGADVVALVDYAQQVSADAVDGLAQMVSASPMMARSAAAGLLVSLLVRRARRRSRAVVSPTSTAWTDA